ncbi:hypothetical protein C0J52_16458 [Blattella germanica]|nr:hypothetical protein C0J52_16458 [Blattella germanica]
MSKLVLLSWAVCGALGWENLPAIPAGRRAEYYLLQDDGGYKYGYDTGTGQSAVVSADPGNQVQGKYEYLGKGGRKVSLSYTAGNEGFVPQLQGSSSGPGYSSGSPNFNSAAQDSSTVDADYDSKADASYAFSIDTDSYKRTESADAKGNVRGQYSYSSQDGGSHSLSYIAGGGTGFVVTGGDSNAVSAAPNNAYVPPVTSSNNAYVPPGNAYVAPASPYSGSASNPKGNINDDGSYSFSFNTADQSREESADSQNNVRGSYSFKAKDDGQTRRVDYTAGAATGFVAQGAHLPVAPSGPAPSTGFPSYSTASSPSFGYFSTGQGASAYSPASPQADGSYSFTYDAGDHSRQESGDAQNNVRGSFSFKAKDDGQTRRIDYEAGAGTGFVAKGSHLPVAPSTVGNGYQAPSVGYGSPVSSAGYDSQNVVVNAYSGAGSNEESPSGDASYSFSYNAGDHFRQESSDAQGNVQGQFSFVAKDGVNRKIDYTAGAGKGFVAKGAHLPVAPAASSSAPSTLGYSSSSFGQYSNIAGTSTTASGFQSPATAYSSTGLQPDGSYSFSYETADHSHQQSGDAQNNVRGSFSFKAKDDGQTRRLNYEAGAATGFVAKGDHLPVAPPLPSGYSSLPTQAPVTAYSGGFSGPANNALSKTSGPSGDGSYSFSYNAGDHSREESADSQGNVRGRFSFTAKDDGQQRQVEYEAGAEKGFIAKGAHIPANGVAATAVSSSAYQPTAYQSPSSYAGAAVDSSQGTGDASYSYSYQTDSSSKQESSDAQGNVVGSFSFVGGDGVSRSLQYTSRGDEGFVASGAHLPSAGAVGSTANGLATGFARSSGTAGYAGSRSSHAKSVGVSSDGIHIQKYLPPESPKKFGYIFDTKA